MLGRLIKRRRATAAGDATTTTLDLREPAPGALPLPDFPGIEPLLDAGDVSAAVALVRRLRPHLSADDVRRAELQLRHEAFIRRQAAITEPTRWPPTSATHLATDGGLPEVDAADLDLETLIAGVRNHGAIIVRGLWSDGASTRLRQMIDKALTAFAGDRSQADPAWHQPLAGVDGDPLSPVFRQNGYVTFDGQVAVGDTPIAAEFVLDEFRRTRVADLVAGYLGERPAVSLEKWTLRRVPPTTNSSWHQDGAFLGTDIHTINLWIALSPCGSRASGLDVVGRRFDHIVPTGTPGAYFDWDVAADVVERERDDRPIVSPEFAPGDAVFFDQFLLHRTGIREGLVDDRYALETWFFAPSSFPGRYAGLLV